MNIYKIPRPTIPDMQAIDNEAAKHIEALERFVETLEFVKPIDPHLLQASKNNLFALRETLRLAIRASG